MRFREVRHHVYVVEIGRGEGLPLALLLVADRSEDVGPRSPEDSYRTGSEKGVFNVVWRQAAAINTLDFTIDMN